MFTVKFIDTKGHEELFEAENVLHIPDTHDGFHSAGLYFDAEDEGGSQAASSLVGYAGAIVGESPPVHPSKYKRCIRYVRAAGRGIVPPTVYVMNKQGSTVATYRL